MNKPSDMALIEEMLLKSVFGEEESSFYVEEICHKCGSNQAQTIDEMDGKGEWFKCYSCGHREKTVTP